MSGKITGALEDLGTEWHITLFFCDAEKLGKFRTSNKESVCEIIDVQYWEHVDLTVLILKSDLINERHNYYKSLGYGYDYEFIPHATVGKGNLVDKYSGEIGTAYFIGNEYVRSF